jgi:hypothetical protein
LALLADKGVIGRLKVEKSRASFVYVSPLLSEEEQRARDICQRLGTVINRSLVPDRLKKSIYFDFEPIGTPAIAPTGGYGQDGGSLQPGF